MKKIIKILLVSLIGLALIGVVWELIYLEMKSEERVYIFPENFKGVVVIAYDQEDGIDEVKESGKVIFNIPQSGILKLKKPLESSVGNDWCYFENDEGKRTELFYVFNKSDMKENKIYVFGYSNVGFENNNESLEYSRFLIGTSNESDSLSRILDKLNPIEFIKND